MAPTSDTTPLDEKYIIVFSLFPYQSIKLLADPYSDLFSTWFKCSVREKLFFSAHTQKSTFFLFFCSRQHLENPTHPPCQQTSAFWPPPPTHLFADVILEWSFIQRSLGQETID